MGTSIGAGTVYPLGSRTGGLSRRHKCGLATDRGHTRGHTSILVGISVGIF
eukprot:COSAG02_NODE_2377_length_9006_cov_6.225864_7_plen_50_part_01